MSTNVILNPNTLSTRAGTSIAGGTGVDSINGREDAGLRATLGGNFIRPTAANSRNAAMQLDSRSVPGVSTNAKRAHTARAKALRPEKVVGDGISDSNSR